MSLTNYLSKYLNIKTVIKKDKNSFFKPETSILRLSNHKSKKFLNWHPKWSINKSLNRIVEWNKKIKYQKPFNVCIDQIKEYLGN